MMIILVEKKACTCIPITFMKLPIHDNSGTINDYNSTLTLLLLFFFFHDLIFINTQSSLKNTQNQADIGFILKMYLKIIIHI